MRKEYDGYLFTTDSQKEWHEEVAEMEKQSEWFSGIPSRSISLESIEGPMFASMSAQGNGIDPDLADETCQLGSKMLLHDGSQHYLVRDTARSSIMETAKLYGSAFGRMPVTTVCEVLNRGLQVARGTSLLLFRYGKCSALHSNADGGYEIMPISELIGIAEEKIQKNFGKNDFRYGSNSHGQSVGFYDLWEAQDGILEAYKDSISSKISKNFAINMMPTVKFVSSDTANNCACLYPGFLVNGCFTRFTDGIQVRHSKRYAVQKKTGCDAFALLAEDLYAQYRASAEEVAKLSRIEVCNGVNAVVSLCKRYNIPKKYGEAAREMVENYTGAGEYSISAHDLFLCMSQVVAAARQADASAGTIDLLEDAVAKIVHCDWQAHDVGGVVSW